MRKRMLLAGIIIGFVAAIFISSWSPLSRYRFEEFSGLDWPTSARLIDERDSSTGPFGTDGIRGFEVEISSNDIERWLKIQPFNGTANWRNCPMKEDGMTVGWVMPPRYVYDSPDCYYAIKREAHGDGALIVLDSRNRRAWLVMWW